MIKIQQQVSLLPYNTFGVQATASEYIETDNLNELSDFIRSTTFNPSPLILGGGSNVLFITDHCALVIHPAFKGIEIANEDETNVWLRVGAGENWQDFVSWCVQHRYSGVENLAFIPGHVGACPVQNIGAYGVEVKDAIEKVEAVDMSTGEYRQFNNEQCHFNYRDSYFKQNKGKYLITFVHFKLSKSFVPNLKYVDLVNCLNGREISIETVYQAIIDIRRKKLPDPADISNAGSFFKNPVIDGEKASAIEEQYPSVPLYHVDSSSYKISAAWLIQTCGWKGVREKNVGTYPGQPLVIVNYGGATGQEIWSFATKIRDSVNGQFGILLESEVNMVYE